MKNQNELTQVRASYFRDHAIIASNILKIEEIKKECPEAFAYFTCVNNYSQSSDYCLKSLDADFWKKILNDSKLMLNMPSDKKDKWLDDVYSKKVPEFNEKNVMATFTELINKQNDFFLERIECLFKELNRTYYKTNQHSGFAEKFILTHIVDNSYNSYRLHYRARNKLQDIRHTILALDGITDEHNHNFFEPLCGIVDHVFGEWLNIDQGRYRIKLFKNGNAHFEMNAETTLKLNRILSNSNDNVLAQFTENKSHKGFKVNFQAISAEDRNKLRECLWSNRYDLKKRQEICDRYKIENNLVTLLKVYLLGGIEA